MHIVYTCADRLHPRSGWQLRICFKQRTRTVDASMTLCMTTMLHVHNTAENGVYIKVWGERKAGCVWEGRIEQMIETAPHPQPGPLGVGPLAAWHSAGPSDRRYAPRRD